MATPELNESEKDFPSENELLVRIGRGILTWCGYILAASAIQVGVPVAFWLMMHGSLDGRAVRFVCAFPLLGVSQLVTGGITHLSATAQVSLGVTVLLTVSILFSSVVTWKTGMTRWGCLGLLVFIAINCYVMMCMLAGLAGLSG